MHDSEHNLPFSINQVMAWLQQCSTQEKKKILRELLDDTSALTIASEPSLAKDWEGEEEDQAWAGL